MNDLEDARKRWLKERPDHDAFGAIVAARVRAALAPLGIWYDVSYRAKGIDSLLKKLIKKSKHTYDSLPDKVGVRVMVRFRSEVDQVVSVLQTALRCGKYDTKFLETNEVGY
jgi:(p)ppGpp synthase/HD superfamily hydrolase